jgi:hypothetical protein
VSAESNAENKRPGGAQGRKEGNAGSATYDELPSDVDEVRQSLGLAVVLQVVNTCSSYIALHVITPNKNICNIGHLF